MYDELVLALDEAAKNKSAFAVVTGMYKSTNIFLWRCLKEFVSYFIAL